METEFDLRPYIDAIIKHWYWIVGSVIMAGLVAFGISSLLPARYTATALVAVTVPQDLTLASLTADTLAPNFTTQNESLSYLHALPELTMGDQLLEELLLTIDPPLEDISSIEELRKIVEAKPGSDPVILRLAVTHHNPKTAAQIANHWATLYVPWANEIFGLAGQDQVVFWQTQLVKNQTALENNEQALIEFEANNRAPILRNNLVYLTKRQSDLLTQQNLLQPLIQDLEALKSQIKSQPNNTAVSFAHQLTALNLQLRAFGVENNNALQLQIDTNTDLTTADVSEQLVFLNELENTTISRLSQIESELEQLEPQILQMQQQLQEVETEKNRLNRNYTEAEESYSAIARKVETERLSAEDTTSGVRLASRATIPANPVHPKKLQNTVVSMMLVAILSTSIILLVAWHKA